MATNIRYKYPGGMHEIDQIFVMYLQELHRVVTVYEKVKGQLKLVYTLIPNPPQGFRAGEITNTTAVLYWDAPLDEHARPKPTGYQILRRTIDASLTAKKDTPFDIVRTVMQSNLPINFRDMFYQDTGLGRRTHYVYTVRSVHHWKDLTFYSEESANAVHVFTGQKRTVSKGVSDNGETGDKKRDHRQFQPNSSNTWTGAGNWRKSDRPAQGFTNKKPNREEYNQRGVVDYSNVYQALVNIHGSVAVEDAAGNVRDVTIASQILVKQAWIQSIGRPEKDGGPDAPRVRLHSGTFAIGAPDQPRLLPITPEGGAKRDDFIDTPAVRVGPGNQVTMVEIDHWWADDWIRRPAIRQKTGLVLYVADGSPLVTLAGIHEAGFGNCWDLVLKYEWEFETRPDLDPFHKPYVWPL